MARRLFIECKVISPGIVVNNIQELFQKMEMPDENTSGCSGDSYGHFILESPTFLSLSDYSFKSRLSNSNSSNYLNRDLLDDDLDELYETLSKIPFLDRSPIELEQNGVVTTQSVMINSSLLLEFAACFSFDIILCSNVFLFAILNGSEDSHMFQYVIIRAINLSFLGIISYLLAGPDTYKSVNITLTYLSINAILYKYSFMNVLRYLCIHFVAAILASLASVGMYYDLIKDIGSSDLVINLFPPHKYSFSYSYALIAFLTHMSVSVGLVVLVDMTNSMNARKRSIHKALFLFFLSIIFGAIIGPIGYAWPNLALYATLFIIRNDYASFDSNMFVAYLITIIAAIILYPIIAIQLKYTCRNKYSRCIEYLR